MAVNEGIRKTSKAIVISESPDVCLTPMGPKKVPVPYDIMAIFSDSQATVPTVQIRGHETFTTASFIQGVRGNEAGCGGGILSAVYANAGICTVVPGTESQFVKAQNNFVVYHTSLMQMNAAAPGAKGNTLGRVVYQSGSTTVKADSDGKVKGNTNPKDKPETEDEHKKKWEHEAKRENATDQGDRAKQYRKGSYDKPDAGKPSIKRETNLKFEKKTFDESVFQTDDGSVKLGNLTGSKYLGAGYDHAEGVYKAGAGVEGGFTTLKTTAQGSAVNGLLNGKVDAELLSAKGEAGVEATFGKGAAQVQGKVGVEVIVAEATGQASVKITAKTIWDNTVGRAIKSMSGELPNPLLAYGEAPDSWDKGIEVGTSGTIGVGAAAEASASAGYDKNAPPGKRKLGASAGAKLGLGPKVGLKAFFNILF